MIFFFLALLCTNATAQFTSPGFFRPSSKMAIKRQVKNASGSALVAGSAAITFDMAPLPKSLILCAAQTTSGSVLGVSDVGNNTYTSIRDADMPAGKKLYYAFANAAPGKITASVTAVLASAQITCFEYTGVTVAPFDGTTYVATTSTVGLTTVTTTSSPEFIFVYIFTTVSAKPLSIYTTAYGGSGNDLAMHGPAPWVGNFKANFAFLPQPTSGTYTMVGASFKLD